MEHVVKAPKQDALWGRPIFRAPDLRPLTVRKKEVSFPARPFKGKVRDQRISPVLSRV